MSVGHFIRVGLALALPARVVLAFILLPFKLHRDKQNRRKEIQRIRAKITQNPDTPVSGKFSPRRKWSSPRDTHNDGYFGSGD